MSRLTKLVIFLVLVLIAWVTSGCATFERPATRDVEYTWLALHAVDTLQTMRFKPCTVEADSLAVGIYGGSQPTDARVAATNIALGYLHYRIAGWIDQRTEAAHADPDDTSYGGWYLFRAAWQGIALIGTGYSVAHNATSHYECP